MTTSHVPQIEFPIAQPAPRYPVIGKMDGARIVTHEDRYESWTVDDIVKLDDRIFWVRDEGSHTRALDITAEYNDMIDRAGLADLAETQQGIVGQEGVG